MNKLNWYFECPSIKKDMDNRAIIYFPWAFNPRDAKTMRDYVMSIDKFNLVL